MHEHRFAKFASRGDKVIILRCSCGERLERPATKSETAALRKRGRRLDEEIRRQNKIAWEFDRRFKKYKSGELFRLGGKTYRDKIEDGWKWTGWELIRRVEAWAKKYPDDVFVSGVDDTHFSSSVAVFILHRPSPRKLWGTSVAILTQCDGIPPKEFFLYPGHAETMKKVLDRIISFKRKYPY